MSQVHDYTITIIPPESDSQLWGARCEELQLDASGETESEAFYNLVENIPIYFEIKNETQRHQKLSQKISVRKNKKTLALLKEQSNLLSVC